MKNWLTIKELAEFLGFSVRQIKRKATAGIIPGYQIGGKGNEWRFDPDEVVSHIRKNYSNCAASSTANQSGSPTEASCKRGPLPGRKTKWEKNKTIKRKETN